MQDHPDSHTMYGFLTDKMQGRKECERTRDLAQEAPHPRLWHKKTIGVYHIAASSKNFYMEFVKRCLKKPLVHFDPLVIGTSVFVSE